MVGDAEPVAAEPRLQKGDSMKRIHAADGGASPDGGRGPPGQKGVGAAKWANAKNAVKGANAFSDGGFRHAARQKLKGTEYGWIGAPRHQPHGRARANLTRLVSCLRSPRRRFDPVPLPPPPSPPRRTPRAAKDIHLGPGVNASKFEFGRVIGTGLMGTVRVACVKKDHQYVVVKSVAKDYVCRHNDARHVQARAESELARARALPLAPPSKWGGCAFHC